MLARWIVTGGRGDHERGYDGIGGYGQTVRGVKAKRTNCDDGDSTLHHVVGVDLAVGET